MLRSSTKATSQAHTYLDDRSLAPPACSASTGPPDPTSRVGAIRTDRRRRNRFVVPNYTAPPHPPGGAGVPLGKASSITQLDCQNEAWRMYRRS